MMSKQSKISFTTATPRKADKASDMERSVPLSRERGTSIASRKRDALEEPTFSPFSVTGHPLSQSDMDSTFELPDSTDWHATSLPAFEPLEAALRCEVCKEFYDNPVITPCSHTFCSICIRRCISTVGKCPTCKTLSQADKLVPNYAVREIVNKFQDARSKALELARQNKDDSDASSECKKRKLGDTDLEEGEPIRQTRTRQTRHSQRNSGSNGMPIEVPDSEDDRDETFEPEVEGLVKCPVCGEPMLEAQVFRHLDTCTGESAGRKTRSSRKNDTNSFPLPLQSRPKEPPTPLTRLPGLNYAMMNQKALQKKLQELGIPTHGRKELLIRRHTEWMHLWNANCDALDNRKPKAQLLKELDVWERTQGGNASTVEPKVMRKDYDGQAHANAHKNQFDDLIAIAKKKREAAKQEETKENSEKDGEDVQMNETAQQTTELQPAPQPVVASHAYEGNETALASIREKVEQANRVDTKLPPPTTNVPSDRQMRPASQEYQGMPNPLGASRKVPMFALPEDPIVDVEQSTTGQ